MTGEGKLVGRMALVTGASRGIAFRRNDSPSQATARRRISESVLSDFNDLRRHLRVVQSFRLFRGRRAVRSGPPPAFRKNNRPFHPAWQEIVDFS